MRQPSIVIHKGKGEERYELYVEDYVISFLKDKTNGADLSDLVFYGSRDGGRYVIYGAGRERNLTVFDKYELLTEISCRLTGTGPVFLVREAESTYEIKGYKIFYYENKEMQDYLIHQKREETKRTSFGNTCLAADGVRKSRPKNGNLVRSHYAISLQVGIVFVVLTAIVINSANSYDKMEQLNQSAAEVFFVMENQETDVAARPDETVKETEQNDIVVERDGLSDDRSIAGLQDDLSEDSILQDNVLYENTLQGQETARTEAAKSEEETDGAAGDADGEEAAEEETTKEGAAGEAGTVPGEAEADTARQEEENTAGQTDEGAQAEGGGSEQLTGEGVEALSRNVARYYEVERGDTLYLISQKIYGDTAHVKKICELNQITNPDNIRYGQKIILP